MVAMSGRGTPATGATLCAGLAATAAAEAVEDSRGPWGANGVEDVVGVVESWLTGAEGVG